MPKGVYPRSAATREKMRLSAIARAATPEGRENSSRAGKKSGGFRGRHSDESKAKMSAAKRANPTRFWLGKLRGPASAETRAKMSVSHKAIGPRTPEEKVKISATMTGRKYSEQRVQTMRAALNRPEVKAKMALGPLGKPCRRPKRVRYGDLMMRSTFEVRVATALDTLGVTWLYESTRFDLGTCTYAPDFYLPELDEYWEVKGWFGPDSQHKHALFTDRYPSVRLKLVFESDILRLERQASKSA